MSGYQRIIAWIIWCVLIAGGVLLIVFGPQPESAGPIATRALPVNTLVLPTDVKYEGYIGRYVVAADGIKEGARLRPQDVANLPTVPPIKLLLTLPLRRAMVLDGVNAGSKVQLCGKAPLAFGTVTVQTVHCSAFGVGGDCTSLVEVPAAIGADIATKGLKDQSSAAELRLATTCN
jgi:hypothetical protein